MLRIKTIIGNSQVYTLFMPIMNKWLTITRVNGKSESYESGDLYEAGFNHLEACKKIKEDIGTMTKTFNKKR